jgi:hypothetical protein
MSQITINGRHPHNPDILRKKFIEQGWDFSGWYGKANSFQYNRGVTPSIGFLLFDWECLPFLHSTFDVDISTHYSKPNKPEKADDESVITIEGMAMLSYIAINPHLKQEKCIYLVTIIDPLINRWHHTYVDKDYNVPIGTEDREVSASLTVEDTVYDLSTLKEADVSTEDPEPWNWKQVFEDLIGDDVTVEDNWAFPTLEPDGLKFFNTPDKMPMSKANAIDHLLSITGLTLIRTKDKKFELKPVDASKSKEAIDKETKHRLYNDSHLVRDEESAKLPEKVKFKFPKISLGDDLSERYETIEKPVDVLLSTIMGFTWEVIVPLYANADNGQQRIDYATDSMVAFDKAWASYERELYKIDSLNFVKTMPDSGISSVKWFSSGDGSVSRTLISTEPDRPFPPQSEEFCYPNVIAKGIATNKTVPPPPDPGEEQKESTIDIKEIQLLDGHLDWVDEDNDLEDVYALFDDQEIGNGDEVLVFYNASKGRYSAVLVGAGVKVVVINTTVPKAVWDDVEQTLKPTEHTVWLLTKQEPVMEGDDPLWKAEETTIGKNYFTTAIDVASSPSDETGRLALIVGDKIFNVDCETIKFIEPVVSE